MSRKISLSQGKVAIVDDADFPTLAVHKWTAERSGHTWYAKRQNASGRGPVNIRMHRVVLRPPPGAQIDHISGDGLDNRRCNLRVCTRSQNQWNFHTKPRGASRFIGVTRDRRGRVWRARITMHGARINLGGFRSEILAAIAYDGKCRELRGEFARPNFSLTVAERKLRDWVSRTGGHFFSICFIKRTDGSERVMLCRTSVRPLPGPSIIKITRSKHLISVWDVQKHEFRLIPLAGILWIRFKGRYIRVARRSAASSLDVTTQGQLFAQTAG